jgi:glycine/sarcosine N-methyltransferase
MEDQFGQIAQEYDRMFLRDIEADRDMLVTFMERYSAKSVLDCACGTGVHTEIIAREGFHIVGSDASNAMLEVARSKLSAVGLAVDLYKSSWRDLPEVVPDKYDVVICMGNSLPLEPDGESVVASLKGMFSMLNEGGALLISNANADRQIAEKVGIEVVEPEPECFLLDVRDFTAEKTTRRFFFIDAVGDEPSMRYFKFELMNLTAEKMELLLRLAGIEKFMFYGEKDFTPYSRYESERLILVAEKSSG